MTEDQIFERRLLDEQRYNDTERKIDDLTAEVTALTKSVEGLVAAWNATGTVVVFVKYLGGLAVAIGTLMAAWKLWFGR